MMRLDLKNADTTIFFFYLPKAIGITLIMKLDLKPADYTIFLNKDK